MATVNNPQNSLPDLIDLQALIAANLAEQMKSSAKGDPKAALAALAQTIEAVLEQLSPSSSGKTSSGKVVHADFRAPANGAPTNAEMQKSIGALMALLTELEGKIAEYGNKNAQANSSAGHALVTEMQSQVNQANDELQKALKSEKSSNFWSIFAKVAEAVVGAIICAVSVLCGQPELAVIILVFTVLSLSGGMTKLTQAIANGISQAMVKNQGMSQDKADAIAKILADIIVIVASIVVTVATCGSGTAAAAETTAEVATNSAEEGAEEGVEMTDMASNSEGSVSQAADETQSFSQRVQSFFSKVGNWIKENNPFNKLPKNVNLGIMAGTSALGTSNFGSDFMTAVLLNMPDSKKKDTLETAIGTIIDLLAALAGAGAGAAVCMGPAVYQFTNIATPLKVLLGLQTVGGAAQFSGEVGSGVAYGQLANQTSEQGQTQTLLSELQALVNMNNGQASSETKALSSKMKTWATELSALSMNLNRAGAAIAKELQA